MISYVLYFFVIFIINFLLLCFLKEDLSKNFNLFFFIVSFSIFIFTFLVDFLESVF